MFDHGWFTVPNEDGTFAIDNVPPGDHTLVAWHERIGERRDRVTIRAGADHADQLHAAGAGARHNDARRGC